MDEHEWLTSDDPAWMLEWLCGEGADAVARGKARHRPSDRRLRLFAVACCRQVFDQLTDPRSRRAVVEMEAQADGLPVHFGFLASAGDVSHEWSARHTLTVGGLSFEERARWNAADAVADLADSLSPGMADRPERFFNILWRFGEFTSGRQPAEVASRLPWAAALLRDIVGSPWRPIAVVTPIPVPGGYHHRKRDGHLLSIGEWDKVKIFLDKWLTPTVLAIARRAYDERDFEALPVLADALAEAGCASEDMLRHLRGQERCLTCDLGDTYGSKRLWMSACKTCHGTGWIPLRGNHARGCHIIDLILDKE